MIVKLIQIALTWSFVYVVYVPTGFRRMYTGTNWETEFEEDLRNQIFNLGS